MNPDSISVIIATFNRSSLLNLTLGNMTMLTLPECRLEFIIVDNNSNDNTREIVNSYKGRLPIRYLFESKPGKNCALNTALGNMEHSEIIVFTDDDVKPEKDWLVKIAGSCAKHQNISVFGGKILPIYFKENRIPFWLESQKLRSLVLAEHDYGDEEMLYPDDNGPFGPNFWVRKEVFSGNRKFNEKIGPRPKRRIMGSESSFLLDLQKDGFRFLYFPDAKVGHFISFEQLTFYYFMKRMFRSGRSDPHHSGFRQKKLWLRHYRLWQLIRLAGIVKAVMLLIASLLSMSRSGLANRVAGAMSGIGYNWEALLYARELRSASPPFGKAAQLTARDNQP